MSERNNIFTRSITRKLRIQRLAFELGVWCLVTGYGVTFECDESIVVAIHFMSILQSPNNQVS